MKKALATILLTGSVAFGLGVPVGGAAQEPSAPQCPADALAQARTLVHDSYALKRFRKHPAMGKQTRAEYDALRLCLTPKDRGDLSEYRDKKKDELGDYRVYRKHAPIRCQSGPYGFYAIPCYIVSCESHYNPRARNPNSSAGGYYQMLDKTWYDYGGKHYPDSHPAAAAPELEQHIIGRKVWKANGPDAWSCS